MLPPAIEIRFWIKTFYIGLHKKSRRSIARRWKLAVAHRAASQPRSRRSATAECQGLELRCCGPEFIQILFEKSSPPNGLKRCREKLRLRYFRAASRLSCQRLAPASCLCETQYLKSAAYKLYEFSKFILILKSVNHRRSLSSVLIALRNGASPTGWKVGSHSEI